MRKFLIAAATVGLLAACDRGADVGVPSNPPTKDRPTEGGVCGDGSTPRPGEQCR